MFLEELSVTPKEVLALLTHDRKTRSNV